MIGIFLVTLADGSMSSVRAAQHQPDASSTNSKLEARVAELEKRIAVLEAQLTALTSRTPSTTEPKLAGAVQADAQSAPLVLDDWSFSSGEGDFGQAHYNITLKLRNAGTK